MSDFGSKIKYGPCHPWSVFACQKHGLDHEVYLHSMFGNGNNLTYIREWKRKRTKMYNLWAQPIGVHEPNV